MKHILSPVWARVFLFSLIGLLSLQAQPGGPLGGGTPGMNMGGVDAFLTKFFGEVQAFSATAEMTIKGKGENMTMPSEFAMLDGKMRMDMDLGKVKGDGMAAAMGPQLKQMGMDKMGTITDPKKKEILLIYPGLKSYAAMAIPKAQAEMMDKEPKVEKQEVGKETVDGHPCKKIKYTITDDKGKKQEALVWTATDLKEFPVKIESGAEGMQVTILYKDIKLEKPAAKLFEPPAEFTKYDNVQALMQGAMMKMMEGLK